MSISVIQQFAPTIADSQGKDKPCANLMIGRELGGPIVSELPEQEAERVLETAVSEIKEKAQNAPEEARNLARSLASNIDQYRRTYAGMDLFAFTSRPNEICTERGLDGMPKETKVFNTQKPWVRYILKLIPDIESIGLPYERQVGVFDLILTKLGLKPEDSIITGTTPSVKLHTNRTTGAITKTTQEPMNKREIVLSDWQQLAA